MTIFDKLNKKIDRSISKFVMMEKPGMLIPKLADFPQSGKSASSAQSPFRGTMPIRLWVIPPLATILLLKPSWK